MKKYMHFALVTDLQEKQLLIAVSNTISSIKL